VYLLPEALVLPILSDEKANGYAHGQITEGFLKAHISNATQ
jgi:hypothetical protein